MAIAGGATIQRLRSLAEKAKLASRSLRSRVALLAAIFVAVPILLYMQFQAVDRQRTELLRDTMVRQGQIIAEGLRPLVGPLDTARATTLAAALDRMSAGRVRIRLLFRPRANAGADAGFFLVAASPPVSGAQIDQERRQLVSSGVLNDLVPSCERTQPLSYHYTNPAGIEELLTSATPLMTDSGCWIVVTSAATTELVGTLLSQPYWKSPEIRFALLIYLAMAGLVFAIFTGIWNDLRGFAKLSRHIRTYRGEGAFVHRNHVPELAPVAEEFDLLVRELRSSAEAVRRAAEDNVHAFKGPLGVIAQSVEPLRAVVAGRDDKSRRALERIEKATERLDALVTAVRRMDVAAAESIGGKRDPIQLMNFVQEFVGNYRTQLGKTAPRINMVCTGRSVVRADPQHLETVLENILDNAVSFTPAGKEIRITCSAEGHEAAIAIADQGPGVPEEHLARIFERYFSLRAAASEGAANFGVGLWIARRNIESIGGAIAADNERDGGLRITIRLPLA